MIRLLERKLGPLSAADRERIASADEAQLDRWAQKVLEIVSLEELFSD